MAEGIEAMGWSRVEADERVRSVRRTFATSFKWRRPKELRQMRRPVASPSLGWQVVLLMKIITLIQMVIVKT